MHEFTHYNPVRLIFGAGSIAHLGELAAKHGRHALLVTGRGAARATGLLERATDLLESAGLRVAADRVTPNPTAALVDEGRSGPRGGLRRSGRRRRGRHGRRRPSRSAPP